jgi:hypothetical protein
MNELTDEQLYRIIIALNKYGRSVDTHEFGLPLYVEYSTDIDHIQKMRNVIRETLNTK